jgi:hypothetical protein
MGMDVAPYRGQLLDVAVDARDVGHVLPRSEIVSRDYSNRMRPCQLREKSRSSRPIACTTLRAPS